jgi:demethylmenaquinone methyltransferase/2-methoxy-6-polyprenyl-1,4-benzoquinol methylase
MAGTAAHTGSTFDCLWCGRSWTTRSADDLEGFARLCPDCLGKAGDNPFLRFRLREALEARAAATAATGLRSKSPPAAEPMPSEGAVEAVPVPGDQAATGPMVDYYEARAPEYDDWYLRRGRYEHGPIHDTAWSAELDAAGRWLDELPLGGRIVEVAAGTGWWSPLLASKGELWLYDAAPAPLERARERLLAHGLRAHIHLRDAWAVPEGAPADALFAGFWLSHVERPRTAEFLQLARRWLRPGGRIAMIDSLPDPRSGTASPAADDRAPADQSVRRLVDGREFTIVKVHRTPDEAGSALSNAGFQAVDVTTTGRFFILATATA